MAYIKIEAHPFNFDKRKAQLKSMLDEKEYSLVISFLRDLANGEVTGKPVKEKRQMKILDMLMVYYRHFNKSIMRLVVSDVRKFKEDLLNNTIKKINHSNYSDETKEDVTETLSRFIVWASPKKASEFASKTQPFKKWFIIRASKKTPETLNESEIKKLYDSCKTIDGKFLIAVLFDSGARIEEFLNLRFEDIEEPTQNHPYYKLDFKEEYSKTSGRKISMFWEHSTETIAKYLASCKKADLKEQVFPKDYHAVRMFLSRLGKKVLNKRVHAHIFRKSSATHYADKLNRQQLCVRYGWRFSSAMPDTYISRAGVDEEKLKEVILSDDLSKMRKENSELKTQFDLLKKKNSEIEKDIKLLMEVADLRVMQK